MDLDSEAIGHRIYEVRRELGPDRRHEMPQRAFAELLNSAAARLIPEEDRTRYDSSIVARLERGERRATLQDVTCVAAVDPKRRGKLWLGWDELVDSLMGDPTTSEIAAEYGVGTRKRKPLSELKIAEDQPAKKKGKAS